jgi:hypothetical protein
VERNLLNPQIISYNDEYHARGRDRSYKLSAPEDPWDAVGSAGSGTDYDPWAQEMKTKKEVEKEDDEAAQEEIRTANRDEERIRQGKAPSTWGKGSPAPRDARPFFDVPAEDLFWEAQQLQSRDARGALQRAYELLTNEQRKVVYAKATMPVFGKEWRKVRKKGGLKAVRLVPQREITYFTDQTTPPYDQLGLPEGAPTIPWSEWQAPKATKGSVYKVWKVERVPKASPLMVVSTATTPTDKVVGAALGKPLKTVNDIHRRAKERIEVANLEEELGYVLLEGSAPKGGRIEEFLKKYRPQTRNSR